MTAEHMLEGVHFHRWVGGCGSDMPRDRVCISGQDLHEQDELDARLADLFKPRSPELSRCVGELLGLEPTSGLPTCPPPLDTGAQ